jgi:hypothetical protein
MVHPCFFCGGAAHPATGHAYSERVLSCRRCTLEAFSFVRGHTNKKASGKKHTKTALSFYECATLFQRRNEEEEQILALFPVKSE